MPSPVIAVSTCWNSHRHADGYAMLRELSALGFRRVELSHGIRLTLVEGILRAVEEGWIEIGSCHNFCPLPAGITAAAPNLYKPSARDARERSQWLRHTKRSIDFAAQVKAPNLVLHLGQVDFFWFNPADRLEKAAGQRSRAEREADPRYVTTRDACVAKLKARAPEYKEAVYASLLEVLPYAAERQVRLCFENREGFDELPIDGEFPELFERVAAFPDSVGYWHDTGHATLKSEACLLETAAHLDQLGERLVGFHLHDVSAEGKDHQPVGSGCAQWEVIRARFRPHHAYVLELSPRVKPEEVLASRQLLETWLPA